MGPPPGLPHLGAAVGPRGGRSCERGLPPGVDRADLLSARQRALGAIASLGCTDLLSQEHILLLARPRLQELSAGSPGPVTNKATKVGSSRDPEEKSHACSSSRSQIRFHVPAPRQPGREGLGLRTAGVLGPWILPAPGTSPLPCCSAALLCRQLPIPPGSAHGWPPAGSPPCLPRSIYPSAGHLGSRFRSPCSAPGGQKCFLSRESVSQLCSNCARASRLPHWGASGQPPQAAGLSPQPGPSTSSTCPLASPASALLCGC